MFKQIAEGLVKLEKVYRKPAIKAIIDPAALYGLTKGIGHYAANQTGMRDLSDMADLAAPLIGGLALNAHYVKNISNQSLRNAYRFASGALMGMEIFRVASNMRDVNFPIYQVADTIRDGTNYIASSISSFLAKHPVSTSLSSKAVGTILGGILSGGIITRDHIKSIKESSKPKVQNP